MERKNQLRKTVFFKNFQWLCCVTIVPCKTTGYPPAMEELSERNFANVPFTHCASTQSICIDVMNIHRIAEYLTDE